MSIPNGKFVVEKIEGMRARRDEFGDSDWESLVRWEGHAERSWELDSRLVKDERARCMIQTYKKEQEARRADPYREDEVLNVKSIAGSRVRFRGSAVRPWLLRVPSHTEYLVR